MRWNERFGWRRLDEGERQAGFHFWCEIGRRMAIKDIPGTLAGLERFNVEYERTRFAATDAGAGYAIEQLGPPPASTPR
jgi:ER-bound oxygenase mpaB/B'/Rubber oxygenase, catalytic domain